MLLAATLIIACLSLVAFGVSSAKARSLASGDISQLHSRPSYHGLYSALWTGIVGLLAIIILGIAFSFYVKSAMHDAIPADAQSFSDFQKERLIEDSKAVAENRVVSSASDERTAEIRELLAEEYKSLAQIKLWGIAGLSVLGALIALFITYSQISLRWRARNRSERIIQSVLMVCAGLAIITTIGIVFSLIGETIKFFSHVPIFNFIFGTHWSPLSGVFEGKVDGNTVGAIPLFAGTFMITIIAMLVSVPVGLLAAIYLSDYASNTVRSWAKPLLEILAGIPTVVYGFFAAITVAPFIRGSGEAIGLTVASESALAAGIVMGIMIIPFISSLSDDVINAVPQSLRDGSYGMGATKAETITKVVLPAALPGIVSAVLLGMSRAIGETMIVVMAAGQGANLTWNPLEAVTTVTVQIVALITGDTEADTAAGPAFSLGFALFCITLLLNIIALRIVQKYRQKYD